MQPQWRLSMLLFCNLFSLGRGRNAKPGGVWPSVLQRTRPDSVDLFSASRKFFFNISLFLNIKRTSWMTPWFLVVYTYLAYIFILLSFFIIFKCQWEIFFIQIVLFRSLCCMARNVTSTKWLQSFTVSFHVSDFNFTTCFVFFRLIYFMFLSIETAMFCIVTSLKPTPTVLMYPKCYKYVFMPFLLYFLVCVSFLN